MGIFTAFTRPGDTTAAPVTTEKTSRRGHHRGSRGPLVVNMSTRPSFGQWLKVTWLDLVTMVIMGVIGLGVSLLSNLSH